MAPSHVLRPALVLLRPALVRCRSLVRPLHYIPGGVLTHAARVATPTPPILPHPQQNPALAFTWVRFYATKKAKAKAKGQSARVNINSALVESIIDLEEVKGDMTAVLDSLRDDFTRNLSVRTSLGALDHIVVVTKDGRFPLNQLGQVSMKSPQLIVVNMTSSPEAMAAASRALRESSMKLNPEVDGAVIKVPIPKVTREHRENLGRLAKQLSNKAKEALRRVRTNALTQVKKVKEQHSEDTIWLLEKHLQQMADNMAADIDKQLAAKTKELLG